MDPRALSRVPLLRDAPVGEVKRLAATATERTYASGDVVVLEAAPVSHLLVVVDGCATAVHETRAGRRVVVGDFPAPSALDKAALLDGRGHTATYVASGPTTVARLARAEVLRLVESVPDVRRHVLLTLAAQVRAGIRGQGARGAGTATERVAAWLCDKSFNGHLSDGGPPVRLPHGQQGLADAIGASRVTVNRALHRLADLGCVRVRPGAVEVVAPELLAAVASGRDRRA